MVLTLATIVRNSWVDAEADVATAARLDRRSIGVLTALYFGAAGLLFLTTLT